MCAWMSLFPSKAQLKEERYKEIIDKSQQDFYIPKEVPTKPAPEFFVPEYKKPNASVYAEELQRQMDYNKRKHARERIESKSPGISEDYSGYPNRPQTPRTIRRALELQGMAKLKTDLETQIVSKSLAAQSRKGLEQQSIKNILQKDIESLEESNSSFIIHKENEKKKLTESWSQAIKNKNMRSNIFNSQNIKPNYYFSNKESNKESEKDSIEEKLFIAKKEPVSSLVHSHSKSNGITFSSIDESSILPNTHSRVALGHKGRYMEDKTPDEKFFEEKIKKIIDKVKYPNSTEKMLKPKDFPSNYRIIQGGRKHFLSPNHRVIFQ